MKLVCDHSLVDSSYWISYILRCDCPCLCSCLLGTSTKYSTAAPAIPKITNINPTYTYETYLLCSDETGSSSGGNSLTRGIVYKLRTYAIKVFRMYKWYAGWPRCDNEGIVIESSLIFREIYVKVPTGTTYYLVTVSPNSITISSLTVNYCKQMGWMYNFEESSLLYLLNMGAFFLINICSTENEDATLFCSL